MIEAYLSKSPNPYKIHIFLDEIAIEYKINWVDVTVGDHKTADFLKISPNAKIPAIIDHDPVGGGEPVVLFESGAILLYLAEKTGQLIPKDPQGRASALKWLFWQVAGLGPMSGQLGHFAIYAPEGNNYAFKRYHNEVTRLYGVMDGALAAQDYLAGTYSIADIACYPWVKIGPGFARFDLSPFPNVLKWLERVGSRPAVISAFARVERDAPLKRGTPEQFQKFLFNNHCDKAASPAFR